MIPRHHILAAFELRFDHASAHVVLAQSLDAVGLPDRAEYEPRDVRALALGLLALGHGRIAGVVEALDTLASEPTPGLVAKGPGPGNNAAMDDAASSTATRDVAASDLPPAEVKRPAATPVAGAPQRPANVRVKPEVKPQGPAAAGTPAKVAGKAATGGRRG